ncbi:hypothetical protein [Streptomyces sp. Ac-502]|uniref:hypothetical protein n=1 Tax=Streptomyces sp. Ac-502 TaxID=3342801 RepID=UPI00386264D2
MRQARLHPLRHRHGLPRSGVGAHPEADWEQLRTVGKGRRSPLAALAKAKAGTPA